MKSLRTLFTILTSLCFTGVGLILFNQPFSDTVSNDTALGIVFILACFFTICYGYTNLAIQRKKEFERFQLNYFNLNLKDVKLKNADLSGVDLKGSNFGDGTVFLTKD